MAIFTRLLTEVKLVSPVDWDTGWVWVMYTTDKNEHREFHLSDLRATGGINEIKAASDALITRCKDCGKAMEAHRQGQHIIVTCRYVECTLYGVTLSTDQYNGLTPIQLEGYRKMVAQMKERNSRGED